MSSKNIVHGLRLSEKTTNTEESVCVTCAKSKISVKPFPKISLSQANEPLSLVHTDICGPINKTSAGGARYFITFIDDYSRYTFVYFLKTRDQVFEIFKDFVTFVEKQCEKKSKTIRSDNGREYLSREFEYFLTANGIKRQLSVAYTPQQNGVAERANRTLVEMARSMLVHSDMDKSFWAEAIRTAAYSRNRCVTRTLVENTI